MPNDHDDAAARVNIHDFDTRQHVDDFGADNQHDYTSADNHDHTAVDDDYARVNDDDVAAEHLPSRAVYGDDMWGLMHMCHTCWQSHH